MCCGNDKAGGEGACIDFDFTIYYEDGADSDFHYYETSAMPPTMTTTAGSGAVPGRVSVVEMVIRVPLFVLRFMHAPRSASGSSNVNESQ